MVRKIIGRTAVLVIACATFACSSTPPLPDQGPMPSLDGATAWLNSAPLTRDSLAGKVVLIDFWTYSCINCLRVLPLVKAWEEKYGPQGLVVIGVHSPEFEFEDDSTNVRAAMTKLGITYPVAMDNDMAIWKAFNNKAWPAHYFIDANGRLRYHHYGEREAEKSELVIQALLKEASADESEMPSSLHSLPDSIAADFDNIRSPETYIGYARAESFTATPEMARDTTILYQAPASLSLNQWGVQGNWHFTRQYAELHETTGSITFRFHARDMNLVLSVPAGASIPFRVTIDGQPPGADAGTDIDANGYGIADRDRMYHLIRQRGNIEERTVTITFDAPGVRAYAFSFG